MPIYTYVENSDPRSKVTGIELEGGLILYIGTYANLTTAQLNEIYGSGLGIVLKEGIVPPATPANPGSNSSATVVAIWTPNTQYKENQLVIHEGEILRTLRNLETGTTYEF